MVLYLAILLPHFVWGGETITPNRNPQYHLSQNYLTDEGQINPNLERLHGLIEASGFGWSGLAKAKVIVGEIEKVPEDVTTSKGIKDGCLTGLLDLADKYPEEAQACIKEAMIPYASTATAKRQRIEASVRAQAEEEFNSRLEAAAAKLGLNVEDLMAATLDGE